MLSVRGDAMTDEDLDVALTKLGFSRSEWIHMLEKWRKDRREEVTPPSLPRVGSQSLAAPDTQWIVTEREEE
jgi:hypothetical protein